MEFFTNSIGAILLLIPSSTIGLFIPPAVSGKVPIFTTTESVTSKWLSA